MTRIVKQHPVKILLAFACILAFSGLKIWDYYPPLSVRDRNKEEISRIKVTDPEDFTFAVFGDNKSNNSFFEPLLQDIDRNKEISFAIDVGDLVDGGERRQYRRFLNQVKGNLSVPLISAIGNHDLDRGSTSSYREIFGPTYYAFQVGQIPFIMLDATTEAGFDRGEREWLENQLQQSQTFGARFVFMHVPPFDPRGNGFDKCLVEKDRKDLLDLFRRYNVTHLFASHIHGYFSGVWEGIPYTITGGGGARLQGKDREHFFHHYTTVQVKGGKADVKVSRVAGAGIGGFLSGLIEDDLVQWGLLLCAGILVFSSFLPVRRQRSS